MSDGAEVIRDTDGREIEVRKLSTRERMRLTRQWGAACDISQWYGQAVLVALATMVDGVPLPQPINAEKVEANADRLGQAGMVAVGAWAAKIYGIDVEDEITAAKN